MLGIPTTNWLLAGGIISVAALYETWRQGGLSALWSYFTKRTTTPATNAVVTDEQAFEATMLLARYRATAKGNPGYEGVMASLKATLEKP